MLANRIALLRQEDEKARRKIKEAKKQTKELIQKKLNYEVRMKDVRRS